MLKTELHTHINNDPLDYWFIRYSAKQLVDKAIEKKFDVLAITCHNLVYENQKLKKYAEREGLLLIFGIEKDIEKKHVLIYNINPKEASKINTFSDLAKLKKEKNLKKQHLFVIAPHPYYCGSTCLQDKIIKYFNLFDAWENSFFYTKIYNNPNQKMLKLAKKYNKPVVGNSDVHKLRFLGKTYTLIDSIKDETAIFEAIKYQKIKIVSTPLSLIEFITVFTFAIFSKSVKILKKSITFS